MNAINNRVMLIGTVLQPPVITTHENTTKSATLLISVTDSFKNENKVTVKTTHSHKIVSRGKLAEIVEKYVVNNTEIAIEGKLQNQLTASKDNTQFSESFILANELLILTKK